jgi:hypothetical protein
MSDKKTTTPTRNEITELFRGNVSFDDNHILQEQPLIDIFTNSILPSHISFDTAVEVGEIMRDTFGGYSEAVGEATVDYVGANSAIETLEAETNFAGVKMGVFYSKPMNESPTEEDYAASLGFGMSPMKPQVIEKEIRGALGKRFAELCADDEE